jgi:hypothetical protein
VGVACEMCGGVLKAVAVKAEGCVEVRVGVEGGCVRVDVVSCLPLGVHVNREVPSPRSAADDVVLVRAVPPLTTTAGDGRPAPRRYVKRYRQGAAC